MLFKTHCIITRLTVLPMAGIKPGEFIHHVNGSSTKFLLPGGWSAVNATPESASPRRRRRIIMGKEIRIV